MDQPISEPASPAAAPDVTPNRPPAVVRKRSNSGTGGLLSRFPFMRASSDQHRPRARRGTNEDDSKPPASPTSSPTTSPPIPSFRTIPSTSNTNVRNSSAGSSVHAPPPPLSHAALQQQIILQQKTRRRRGSLRKVALLGRGAQRERRESYPLSINTQFGVEGANGSNARTSGLGSNIITSSFDSIVKENSRNSGFGLGISGVTPRPSASMAESDSEGIYTAKGTSSNITSPTMISNSTDDPTMTSPTISCTTTDDEDALHMASSRGPGVMPSLSRSSTSSSVSSLSLLHPERASVPSLGPDSYFSTMPSSTRLTRGPLNITIGNINGSSSAAAASDSIQGRRRSSAQQQQRAKSPLSLTTPMPSQEAVSDFDYYDDYSDTEFWGWIILLCTWITFVIGMGSCFGVWSWAWDVGTTPYAPPEFEDDPTLPIVGYYPALFVLTWMMVWVWVSVSWVGMKYFRHARVGGD
ncbi:hypothetical protein GE21DRAFT_7669 [Neurospora crassa]|uniref:Uncharacterized protein n=2 Tax=Neurospora crassa TaxID=5141 RepID=Q1K6I7_NEUCR|nr:hypothetical protein NCU01253 [Neurospora crassa OR74A]EAA31337.1 hypothetical protein NCU01253 [Neurospora crassa OR74A]KHE87815.1 hypothetical protein GE21DRAFT_7669 [Neurospora crassa]CAD70845.1 putative protein [Neurospora crassa]|eukprot:XP_960573.1 hypothetical protein NCU01253 [Neurospora crassa OR74A]